MQQEIQYLKNNVKNLFEEKMKLRSQIEGITQEMKPGNNHTPTAYDETNKIKKSLKTLAKIRQEHRETINRDIINIENDIRNIVKELAKQAKKISEQMKSFEKTDSSVKELWEIVDGLADNGSPWFIIGKNEKAQKPSEPTEKPQEAEKREPKYKL